jgi:hypothetical protein
MRNACFNIASSFPPLSPFRPVQAFAFQGYPPVGFVDGSAGWTVIVAALTSNGMP